MVSKKKEDEILSMLRPENVGKSRKRRSTRRRRARGGAVDDGYENPVQKPRAGRKPRAARKPPSAAQLRARENFSRRAKAGEFRRKR
jgi:hypothetical protein